MKNMWMTQGQLRDLWSGLARNPVTTVAMVFMVTVCVLALGADHVAPHSPLDTGAQERLPPFFLAGGSMDFPLGTDEAGRCVLSRLIHGAGFTLTVSFRVVLLGLLVAVPAGLIAAFAGGPVDMVLMRATDIMLAMPTFLLAVVIVALFESMEALATTLALALVYTPHLLRLARAAALTELGKDYVAAARVDGAGTLRLMAVTVLPNCMAPLIVQATLSFSSAILDIAALGFLGLGQEPPAPEWGGMLAELDHLNRSAWWLPTFPGVAILTTVLALNILGDALRDALDPKLRRR